MPAFAFTSRKRNAEIEFGRGPSRMRYLLRNTNELLGRDNIDGVKTGRTERAGDCLVLSAARSVGGGAARNDTLDHSAAFDRGGAREVRIALREGEALLARGWSLYDRWAAAGRPLDPKQVLGGPNE